MVTALPWDVAIGSNPKDMAAQFIRHNRVLYVNQPLDRITGIRERHTPATQKRRRIIAGKEPGLVPLQENLWTLYPPVLTESINWVKPGFWFKNFNRYNARLFCKEILKAADSLNFSDFILINDSLMFTGLHLTEMLQPSLNAYYIRDNLVSQPYFARHGSQTEPEVIAKSDLVLANSTYLADYARQSNPYAYYVGQGCELSLFDPEKTQELPPDLQKIPSPRIGYVGFLTAMRLDIGLLAFLAKSRPDWQIVLVGPEDEVFRQSTLHGIPNVHFLGAKDPEQIPAYVAGFEVCINPQAVNPLTIGNYPRKVDEYLAMGKPVVATRTRAMEVFEEHTYLAVSPEDYVEKTELALVENSPEKAITRRRFARTHTWENSVEAMYEAIENYKEKMGKVV
jgi:teichuronic acid biosynthesis glycosyltransferase TuaH